MDPQSTSARCARLMGLRSGAGNRNGTALKMLTSSSTRLIWAPLPPLGISGGLGSDGDPQQLGTEETMCSDRHDFCGQRRPRPDRSVIDWKDAEAVNGRRRPSSVNAGTRPWPRPRIQSLDRGRGRGCDPVERMLTTAKQRSGSPKIARRPSRISLIAAESKLSRKRRRAPRRLAGSRRVPGHRPARPAQPGALLSLPASVSCSVAPFMQWKGLAGDAHGA